MCLGFCLFRRVLVVISQVNFDPSFSVESKNTKLPYLLIAILSASVFLNSLHSGFVYDDIGVIEDNYFIRTLHNVPKIFSKEYFHLSNELSYRPLVTLSYFIDWAIWQMNPFGYHLTNGILHTINGVLLYSLVVRLIRVRSVALLSAVLFSMHPCVTEAVNAVSYREDLFVALFTLVSCLFLIQSGRNRSDSYGDKAFCSSLPKRKMAAGDNDFPVRHAPRWRERFFYAMALFAYLLSLFSKETAMVTPLFILLYGALCMRQAPHPTHSLRRAVAHSSPLLLADGHRSVNLSRTWWVKDFPCYYLGYVLVSLFYLLIRFVVLKNPVEVSVGYVQDSIAINFMTMVMILASYVKLLFFPFRLSADYTITPVTSVFGLSFLASGILLIAVGGILFRVIKRGWDEGSRDRTSGLEGLASGIRSPVSSEGRNIRKLRIYSLFMLCFFVALLPVLNIIPIGHIMADRYLYLPVAGFCVAISGLLLSAAPAQSPEGKQCPVFFHQSNLRTYVSVALIVILCVSFSRMTLMRNRDWQNEYTFWTKILKEQPHNYDAHNNLGNYFYRQGKLDRAVRELEEAVRLNQNYPEGHNSLGTMYMDKGLIDKAVAEYAVAIKLKPQFPQAYYNLGNAFAKKGLPDDGIGYFQKAVSLGMYNPQVFNNLGSAYMRKGMTDDAVESYQKALSVSPDFAEVHSNLGYVYTERGDLERAASELKEALRLQPGHANAHNNLGAVYCQKGLFDMAQQEFLAAVSYDPRNASAHKNIGMIYFTKGDKERARAHLSEMLKYDPNYLRNADIYAIVSDLGLIRNQANQQRNE